MLLHPMLTRLAGARDLDETLEVAVRDFVALHGAEMGDLQLLAADGALVIVSARGITRAFLETFERVALGDGSVCARAARDARPSFVPDVSVDPQFEPYRDFAASVPFRSVLSCPLMDPGGALIGMLSALSSTHFEPTALELETATRYCAAVAAAIVRLAPARGLPEWAERKSAALLKATPSHLPAGAPA